MRRYLVEANVVYRTCSFVKVADLPAETPVRIFTQDVDEATSRWGRMGWVEGMQAGEADVEYAFVTDLTLGAVR